MGRLNSMRDVCVARYVLERFAASQPDETFACFQDGGTWSYAEMLARTRRVAAALQKLDVRQGDHVLMWLPNGRTALEVYFAINYIGAVYIPINTAYRGPARACRGKFRCPSPHRTWRSGSAPRRDRYRAACDGLVDRLATHRRGYRNPRL